MLYAILNLIKISIGLCTEKYIYRQFGQISMLLGFHDISIYTLNNMHTQNSQKHGSEQFNTLIFNRLETKRCQDYGLVAQAGRALGF